MDADRSLSSRATRRTNQSQSYTKVGESEDDDGIRAGKWQQDPLRLICGRGFIRLVFVSAIIWMLLILAALAFHLWSCHSSIAFLTALCKKDSKVLKFFRPKHRCLIPVADDPDVVAIPEKTPDRLPKKLTYISVDEKASARSPPRFGGHQSWSQREESFKLNKSMQVHCGFVKGGGGDMDAIDVKYVKKCRFIVASGIFDGYDTPNQPSNISERSQKLFCFLLVVDEVSLNFIKKNVSIREDFDGGKWVGIWRLITMHNPPYDEPRRNGKVPKIIMHRLFPQARYSIWIDGKMELIVDPLLILERYLWRGKNTFAIAVHKHHRSIYEEGDAIKRRKRYARPLVDLHLKIYRYEGMELWSREKRIISDVPEGAVIIREHTVLTNLFCCLWFNEVDLFTPRDQISFGYVVYRLGDAFNFFMFPNCEYNSLFILHNHTREHSSKVEWVKSLDEFKENKTDLKESRGGLGLWSPYPGDLSSIELPPVTRTSPAG